MRKYKIITAVNGLANKMEQVNSLKEFIEVGISGRVTFNNKFSVVVGTIVHKDFLWDFVGWPGHGYSKIDNFFRLI